MRKWEYLFIKVESAVTPYVLEVNGRKEKPSQKPTKWETADRLGAEGWELLHTDNEPEYWEMIFKRPKD
ncbi:MAG: hypothetical protein M3444_00115 [Acidobacteriota bacterium]|nr:hypothetical protein [Acidobacteriota bacterium]MDQ5835720.1 hypothetical protein [Acidobacteriota bacterium]